MPLPSLSTKYQNNCTRGLIQITSLSEIIIKDFTCIVFVLRGTGPCFPWSAPAVCDSVASESGFGPTDDDSLPPNFLSAGSTTKTHTHTQIKEMLWHLPQECYINKGKPSHNTAGLYKYDTSKTVGFNTGKQTYSGENPRNKEECVSTPRTGWWAWWKWCPAAGIAPSV